MARFFRSYGVELTLVAALALAVLFFGYLALGLLPRAMADEEFAGSRALDDVGRQMAYGSRSTGTQGNAEMGQWLVQQLTGLGWDVVIQEVALESMPTARNLIAIRNPGENAGAPVGILATHYDTRIAADGDPTPENRQRPAPGANNGASGTAVLLELARTLDVEAVGHTVCLAFFDADANDGLPGWNGRLGSAHFAATVVQDVPRCGSPRFVVALDMVGSPDAAYRLDPAADPALGEAIWRTAQEAGFGDPFLPEAGVETLNAHTYFAAQGIPTALIADLDYAEARTLADTADRVQEDALQRVGRTLEEWLEAGARFGADQ